MTISDERLHVRAAGNDETADMARELLALRAQVRRYEEALAGLLTAVEDAEDGGTRIRDWPAFKEAKAALAATRTPDAGRAEPKTEKCPACNGVGRIRNFQGLDDWELECGSCGGTGKTRSQTTSGASPREPAGRAEPKTEVDPTANPESPDAQMWREYYAKEKVNARMLAEAIAEDAGTSPREGAPDEAPVDPCVYSFSGDELRAREAAAREAGRVEVIGLLRHVHDLGPYGGKLSKEFRAGLEDVAAWLAAREPKPDDPIVCAECGERSCWDGQLMCDRAKVASAMPLSKWLAARRPGRKVKP